MRGISLASTSFCFLICYHYFHPRRPKEGQIVGARESLNGWEKMARKKGKVGLSPRYLLFFAPFFSACLIEVNHKRNLWPECAMAVYALRLGN